MSASHFTAASRDVSANGADVAFSAAASGGTRKRIYDVFFAALGLGVLSPFFLAIAAVIKLAQGGPVFYRQVRVGQHGRPFLICKFRTMIPNADTAGSCVTKDGDPRITGIGRILRKTKLDELPQLWNVLKGDMSLVGPRPEVPSYVERYTPEQRRILELKPGITDLASLHFRNEEMLLKYAEDLDGFYLCRCLPRKLQLNCEYARKATLLSDTWIILQTICPYRLCLLAVYSLLLAAAFWLACLLVYDFSPPPTLREQFAGAMFPVVAVQLGSLIWNKQCRGLLSFFSLPELRQLAAAFLFACLLLLGLRALAGRDWPPKNLLLVDSLLGFCALGGFRLLLRRWRETSSVEELGNAALVPVCIIGAGGTGTRLARELTDRKEFGRTVVAFFDDDHQKWNRRVHDIPVVGMPECLLEGWATKVQEAIIAIPNASTERLRELQELIGRAGLKAYMAPSIHTLWRTTRTVAEQEPSL